jgi:hypothetical protein
VECFHRFLNKTFTMETNDRHHPNKEAVVTISHLADYTWYSAPIDGTATIHSVPAVGREFRFPFNFEYVPSLDLTTNNATRIHEFLELADRNGKFSAEIFKFALGREDNNHKGKD